MKKYLAMAAILAGVSATATAAPTAVTVTNDGASVAVSTGTAGQYTLSGTGATAAGGKFYATQAEQDASYVKVAFTVTGGANVNSYIANNQSQVWTATTSTKGNQVFGGNTTSGAVKLIGACASATACVQSDASSGMSSASSM